MNSLSIYTKGYNDNRSVHQEYPLDQSKWTINKIVSIKYEVPNIITYHNKIVATSSLETKIKHIKRTLIKISWLYNSLLYKAGNSKQKGSLIHYLFPSKHSLSPKFNEDKHADLTSQFTVKQAFSPTLHFPSVLSLGSCHNELLFVKKCFLHDTCLEHEVLPYKGSD